MRLNMEKYKSLTDAERAEVIWSFDNCRSNEFHTRAALSFLENLWKHKVLVFDSEREPPENVSLSRRTARRTEDNSDFSSLALDESCDVTDWLPVFVCFIKKEIQIWIKILLLENFDLYYVVTVCPTPSVFIHTLWLLWLQWCFCKSPHRHTNTTNSPLEIIWCRRLSSEKHKHQQKQTSHLEVMELERFGVVTIEVVSNEDDSAHQNNQQHNSNSCPRLVGRMHLLNQSQTSSQVTYGKHKILTIKEDTEPKTVFVFVE